MVLKTGYILPPQNYIARMNALEQGLANNRLKSLSILESPKVVVPSQSYLPYQLMKPETGIKQIPPSATFVVPDQFGIIKNISSIPSSPYSATPTLARASVKLSQQSNTAYEPLLNEVKQRIALGENGKFGLKNKDERIARETMGLEDVNVLNSNTQQAEIPAKALTPTEVSATSANVGESIPMSEEHSKALAAADDIIDSTTFESFKSNVDAAPSKIKTGLVRKGTEESDYLIPTKEKSGKIVMKSKSKISSATMQSSFNYLESDKEGFKTNLYNHINSSFGVSGSGIKGGRLFKPNYQRNAPNFGNLFLNERALKKGNLSISQPFSKTYLLHKKNITPLLKKMILDIANTLEFDVKDYENLDGEEKRIIEKIIRAQKNMKEYNIKKLIDNDDYKMKKRLEILVGEINAGNASTYVKDEIRQLLKGLFDNRAISIAKYRNSIKAINNL